MAVKIRLKRMGSKKKPFYRIVVADSRAPRDGKFIEEIGYYNPLTESKEIKVDAEKVNAWIKNGAKPTDTVNRLFKNDNPENLVITTEEDGELLKIFIKADENDIGKIIGKQGKIAKAIRTIVRSSAMKLGKKVIIEIN